MSRDGEPLQLERLGTYGTTTKLFCYFSERSDSHIATTGKTLYVLSENEQWAYIDDFFEEKLKRMLTRAWHILRDSPSTTEEQVVSFCRDVLRDALGDGVPEGDADWLKMRRDIAEMKEITRDWERQMQAPRAPVAPKPRREWQG
jgi:hypothetical protein